MMKVLKTILAIALLASIPLSELLAQDDPAEKRVLSIKPRIVAKSHTIRVKDIAVNYQILSDFEREMEVTEAPTCADENITIVDLAYMLQRHPELMNIRLKGPRTIVLQKVADSTAVDKAKSDIVSQIKGMPPWKDWEIDVILSTSDETTISKAWPFSKVEILPSENKTMIGAVNLNVAFIDDTGRQSGKSQLNPTILKKVNVVVLNVNGKQGQVVTDSIIKKIPMWIGPENKDYISDSADCVGRELAKPMSAGEIIKAYDVINPICAKKGDMVWVECKSGALTVKLAVTALEAGRQGDMIKVMNQPTQKVFSVRLTGEKQGFYSFGS